MRCSPHMLPSAWAACLCALAALSLPAAAWGQLQITEVMHNPAGDFNLWEWVEVRNTTASTIDLDEWIFDDDDDVPIAAEFNISAENGNTEVPAGGIAVLYAASDLDFMPERFTDAWGGGITLIPVTGFTTLTATDAIGLWSNREAYDADDLGAGMNPRRSFASAEVSLDYSSGFPNPALGRSIAWDGTGSPTDGARWVESEIGVLQAFESDETFLSAPLNSPLDRANPGVAPGGAGPPGLQITEIMYHPDSSGPGWEWVEVRNNSALPIDFSAAHHVLHDDDGADFSEPNIMSGVIPPSGLAVLFNAEDNTLENMQAAWGAAINFIPVLTWGNGLADADTVAIWDDFDAYEDDSEGASPRSTDGAIAVVSYSNTSPWPGSGSRASIYLEMLNLDPTVGDNWVRSVAEDAIGSYTATEVIDTIADNPGHEVGSPGRVGASTGGTPGDFNNDGRVDAGDYVRWRNNLGDPDESGINFNGDGGGVGPGDYALWKSQYGNPGSGGLAHLALSDSPGADYAVPEPGGVAMLVVALAVMPRARPALRSPLRRPEPRAAAAVRQSRPPAPGRPGD